MALTQEESVFKSTTNVAGKGKAPMRRALRVGKLMQVLNVPVDVFFEIASHLDPLDILQLSRVSIQLRNMLHSRSARHVWLNARKNLCPPPPECPSYLSEAQYAYLLFEVHCVHCGEDGGLYVHYAGGVRLCRACWNSKIKRGGKLANQAGLNDAAALKVIFKMLPEATQDGTAPRMLDLARKQNAVTLFYEPHFSDVARRYREIQSKGDHAAVQRFVDECEQLRLDRLKFRNAVARWYHDWCAHRDQLDKYAEVARKKDIVTKLREAGFEKCNYPTHNSQWDTLMAQACALDLKVVSHMAVWEDIRPKMIEILENECTARANCAIATKWQGRRTQLRFHYDKFLMQGRDDDPDKRTLPNFAGAIDLPCMKRLLMSEEPDADITRAQFAAIESVLREEAEASRAKLKKYLVGVLQSPPGPKPPALNWNWKAEESCPSADSASRAVRSAEEDKLQTEGELLNSPCSVFVCNWGHYDATTPCHLTYSYLGLLEHWQAALSTMPWVPRACVSDLRELVPYLLKTLGLSEETTTHLSLDEVLQSGRLECSCRKDLFPEYAETSVPKVVILGKLLEHLAMSPCPSNKAKRRGSARVTKHRITLVPAGDSRPSAAK
ncbi:hypothetical protein C8Q74DRAFT_1225208 [Fomes fomentarius]|nr:hypothetical protein C8Q74DRAFT_1225208 [Fomes fomentarius]